MRIAILGSASSSLSLAPFKNEHYRAWIEGRIDRLMKAHAQISEDFDIWGCSPGCWAQIPRASRWFEVHRFQPEAPWFTPEYLQFLQNFKGPVYTGGRVPELPNHIVYPIDEMEEKFSSYFMMSSISLMLALAIDTIEKTRLARRETAAGRIGYLPAGVDAVELVKSDADDIIGLWGIDMAAGEEYAYQRPGCQFFMLEAMRRGIAVYVPPESDLMRPMPVYGISEWDHNYIKLTSRARELNNSLTEAQRTHQEAATRAAGVQGEISALNHFVSTWTSPYGMQHGIVIRHTPGSGLGGGITHVDARPVSRMPIAQAPDEKVAAAMAGIDKRVSELEVDAKLAQDLVAVLVHHAGERGTTESAVECLKRIIAERASAYQAAMEAQAKANTKKKRKP